jgi:hypothetical protein
MKIKIAQNFTAQIQMATFKDWLYSAFDHGMRLLKEEIYR